MPYILTSQISQKAFDRASNIDDNPRRDAPIPILTGASAPSPTRWSGAWTADEGTAGPVPINGTGYEMWTSYRDWYYRIHINPVQFTLGNLVGNQQRSVLVWNAYFTDVSLEDFTVLNGDGIIVDEPVNPPVEIRPLKTLVYQFEITTDGPPVIDATAVWTIDGVEYTVPFTGRRIVVFPFKPNWSSPVEETLQWNNMLETTYTGKEQVWEIRAKPRRILQYNLRLFREDVNRFDNVTFGWTARMFAVPLWQEKTKLATPTVAGGTTFSVVETANRTFEAGALGLIYTDILNYEIIEIASVAGNDITTARPIERVWPVGALVYPMIVAAPEANIPTTRQSDTHMDAIVRFTVSPADNYVRLPETSPPALYRGVELYTGETNWIAPLNVDINARQQLVDEETGIFRLVRRTNYPLIQRGFRWLVKNKDQAEDLREFFGRRRGRLKPVWVPSGQRDFILTEPATSASTTLYVSPNDYGTFVNLHAARRDIVVILRDGTKLARRIVSYGVDEFGRGALAIDSGLGVNVTPDSVKKISYLGFYRLAADSITLSWRTGEVMVVETNFVLKESP